MKKKDKYCKKCGILMMNVFVSKMFCDECNEIKKQENIKKQNKKPPKRSEDELERNFLKITQDNGYTLTTIGFNKNSKISVKCYTRFYKNKNWIQILDYFGKKDKFFNYLKQELEVAMKVNYSLKKFIDNHQYISHDLFFSITKVDIDNILEGVNFIKLRYTDEYLKNNFLEVCCKIGKIPFYNEFNEISSIPTETYALRYKLKGVIYDKIVKMYTNESDYNEFLIRKKEHKKLIGFKSATTENAKKAIKKARQTLYKNGNAPCSSQQLFIHQCIGGELNYPEGYYLLDIAFLDEKIYCEYDGGAHAKAVKIGRITQDEFNKKEIIRWSYLKRKGWKEIRVVSLADKLPNKEKIIEIIQYAKDYLNTGHTFIKFDIDNNKIIKGNSEEYYNFGATKEVKKSDLNAS